MEQVFQFIGSYWWLVFPLMGVMASVGGAWERRARRRHRRRLEVLHAKAELKAAEAAARGRGTVALPVPQSGAATSPTATQPWSTPPWPAPPWQQNTDNRTPQSQLERLFAAHDAVTARWLEYELDIAKLIAYPAMSDGRQPLTAAFLRAKKMADGLRPATAKSKLTRDQLAEYRNAVTDFEVAFDVAERDARRIRDSGFTEGERKRLDTAKQLPLSVAIDQAATPAERQLAYRRVREELDGLISLSDEAIVVLEKQVSLELTTGPTPQPAPASAAGKPTNPPQAASAGSTGLVKPPTSNAAPWPVPARTTETAPGRVVHPKPRP